jgi:sulfopyruvate decarboxylase subunit alpha
MQLVDVTMDVLRQHGVKHLVTVANFETEALRHEFEIDPDLSVTGACREGEAVAIASGLVAGGERTVLCMENLGFFECLDTLRAMPRDMGISVPMFVGYCGRGSTWDEVSMVGGMVGQRVLGGDWTEPVLDATKIPYRVILPETPEAEVREILDTALAANEPFVVLLDTFDKE